MELSSASIIDRAGGTMTALARFRPMTYGQQTALHITVELAVGAVIAWLILQILASFGLA